MRKKLFAILMSAMMMVTFMPAMAFADVNVCAEETHQNGWYVKASTVEWNADYTEATGDVYCAYDGKLVKADVPAKTYTKSFNNGFANPMTTGFTTVTAKWGDNLNVDFQNQAVAVYADITGATVKTSTSEIIADDYMDYVEKYKDGKLYLGEVFEVQSVTLKAPAGAECTNKFSDSAVVLPMKSPIMNALAHCVYTEAVPYEAYEEGTYTLTLKVDEDKVPAGINVLGTTTKDIKIIKGGALMNLKLQAEGFYDEKGNVETKKVPVYELSLDAALASTASTWNVGYYDAAEHAISVASKNVTVEYALTKVWKDTDNDGNLEETTVAKKDLVWTSGLTVKDAGDTYFIVRYLVSDPDSIKAPVYVYSGVVKAHVYQKVVKIKFIQDSYNVEYGVVKTPADVLVVEGVCDADKAVADEVCAKLAPNAVKGFFTQAGTGTLVIDGDTLEAVRDAMTNYDVQVNPMYEEMTLVIVKAGNEVTCPTTNKTVKYSKVKKAAQKVSVKMTANHGEVKLTKVSGSANLKVQAGKIVVKKGTKKGTYKIKVKAYVAGTANYDGAKITKTITIRVK